MRLNANVSKRLIELFKQCFQGCEINGTLVLFGKAIEEARETKVALKANMKPSQAADLALPRESHPCRCFFGQFRMPEKHLKDYPECQ